ncbi:MAG: DUF4382 domain-containing protein [Bacteroidetes bacterium]|nr:DUF4382 domain-containing protein [Bacteroidota bacterium]
MNYSKMKILPLFVLMLSGLIFTSCDKEDDMMDENTGTVQFEITDAPIDDEDVEAVFVTVAEVRVDGEAISDFEGRKTIDLMAYQNGNTEALGLAELEAGTYSDVSLVLDYETDADGNSPGCYVRDQQQTKHAVRAKGDSNSQGEFRMVSNSFTVTENSQTNIVLDFDVRKAVRYEDNPQPDDRYEFASKSETEASIRVVSKAKAGTITGNCSDNLGIAGDRIVAYAYAKGDFDANTETSEQGDSDIMFRNAVSSAVVAENGDFQLSFLEEGDYELHFAGYEDADEDGQVEFKGLLEVDLLLGLLDLLDINLDASASVNAEVDVIAIIP